jgi:hypothetical protein
MVESQTDVVELDRMNVTLPPFGLWGSMLFDEDPIPDYHTGTFLCKSWNIEAIQA